MNDFLFHGFTLPRHPRKGVLADVVGAVLVLASVLSLSALAAGGESKEIAPATPTSGIDTQYIDHSVRPQDDFYRYVNGKWLDTTEIPADKERASPSAQVDDAIREHLKTIIEDAQQTVGADDDGRKIADLYTGFMDEQALERLRLKPLDSEFARITALKNKQDMAGLMGHLDQLWVPVPVSLWLLADQKDSRRYAVYAHPDGLGLPSRNYYIENNPKLTQVRTAYVVHIQKMLALSGDKDATQHAREILALETRLAMAQWNLVDADDPVKTYNRTDIATLGTVAPGYDWQDYFTSTGVAPKTDWVVLTEPSYMKAFAEIVQQTPLPVWKTYLRWHLLSAYAPYLSREFVDEEFAFDATTLRGTTQNKPRWKRAIDAVEEAMGEGLGRLYVERYFPRSSKVRVDAMVKNLIAASARTSTRSIGWRLRQSAGPRKSWPSCV